MQLSEMDSQYSQLIMNMTTIDQLFKQAKSV
jgi:hypothetical protein